MNIAIFTMGSPGADMLADAAARLGHTVERGLFETAAEKKRLFASDVFIPLVAHRTYSRAVQLTEAFALQQPAGVLAATANGIRLAFDKYHAYEHMVGHAVPTPATFLITTPDEALQYAERLPLIVKPRTENQGRNIALVKTSEALRDHVTMLIRIYGSCIVQEFVAESTGRDIRAFVVGNKVVAAIERQAPKGSYLANLARGASAVALTLAPDEEALAIRATKLFGSHYAGVDILRSNNGPLVLEVNVSPGLKIATITKKDIPALVVEYLVNQKDSQ